MSELTYERAKQLYTPYDEGQMRHLCALRDVEIDRLRVENAKLRELVADMYRCSDPCNDCPHYNGSNDGFYCDLGVGWKAKRMRELGVEVDDE